ncbi:hypothetical protein CDAR_431021 [Caerostris darwini]|uniref:Uncharacterized protein n=1 Tax=Caerostris darwini TaxID=1538125 RepID=A0AAV4REP2_9ARAC|nr:hypothetical protein CDAR_431021 [Caerostris darwini]
MVEDYSHCRKITDFMHVRIEGLFESFIMISKYEEALDIICKCTNVLPTPLVVNKVIFEVIKNCNGEQAHKAAFYLEDALSMTPEDLNFDFENTLLDSTGTFHDIWSVLAHFVK